MTEVSERDWSWTTDDPRGLLFVVPSGFSDMDAWHAQVAAIRSRQPVLPVRIHGFEPFWVLTRHSDIFAVSRDNDRWLNTSRVVLAPDIENERMIAAGLPEPGMLIHLDGRHHRDVRHVTNDWFKPAAVKHRQPRIDQIADMYVERMRSMGGRCDFATDIAAPYTLRVIGDIYGIPEDDDAMVLDLTKAITGASDAELSHGTHDPGATVITSMLKFAEYFNDVTVDRRAHPADDLATVIANAEIDGCPMGDVDRLWYYIIFATAGHDTTAFGLSGGMEALLSHPDQWEALVGDPGLVVPAADEIIRWTSPVRHFMRYAAEDTQVRDVTIPAGGRVLLSYPSANRDEEVFADPMTFDISRPDADKLLSFGVGGHFCLGAQFARREIRTMIGKLTQQLDRIELDGEPQWSEAHLVSGVKHLPVRYRFRA